MPLDDTVSNEAPKTERVHCNGCGHKTKHTVVATRKLPGSELIDGKFEIEWLYTYDMLECLGCESICMRRTFWWSEEPQSESVEYYPPPVSRRSPKWAEDLPSDLKALLHEVYVALHADSRRLAVMGARAIIDLVMQAKVGDIGGFEEKLGALVGGGYISARNRDVLRAALSAGHAAAHRGHNLSAAEVGQVMDIVENLLHTDLLEESAEQLAQTVPARPRKPVLPPGKGAA